VGAFNRLETESAVVATLYGMIRSGQAEAAATVSVEKMINVDPPTMMEVIARARPYLWE
jgi:Mn-dependent DtxR family transcriptional regulator